MAGNEWAVCPGVQGRYVGDEQPLPSRTVRRPATPCGRVHEPQRTPQRRCAQGPVDASSCTHDCRPGMGLDGSTVDTHGTRRPTGHVRPLVVLPDALYAFPPPELTRRVYSVSIWRTSEDIRTMGRSRAHVRPTRLPRRLGIEAYAAIFERSGHWMKQLFPKGAEVDR